MFGWSHGLFSWRLKFRSKFLFNKAIALSIAMPRQHKFWFNFIFSQLFGRFPSPPQAEWNSASLQKPNSAHLINRFVSFLFCRFQSNQFSKFSIIPLSISYISSKTMDQLHIKFHFSYELHALSLLFCYYRGEKWRHQAFNPWWSFSYYGSHWGWWKQGQVRPRSRRQTTTTYQATACDMLQPW